MLYIKLIYAGQNMNDRLCGCGKEAINLNTPIPDNKGYIWNVCVYKNAADELLLCIDCLKSLIKKINLIDGYFAGYKKNSGYTVIKNQLYFKFIRFRNKDLQQTVKITSYECEKFIKWQNK